MKTRIAIIGLGYVGLPLARLFATKFPVVGFDVNQKRVNELMEGLDLTLEVDGEQLKSVLVGRYDNLEEHCGLFCTTNINEIKDCDIYIVTVPTPIDKYNQPDLTPLIRASESVGRVISKGNIVIYESTVYPGATEDDCIPVIEKVSGLKYNVDFFAGYSPERINPGDKEHTVEKIKKVTSGSSPEIAIIVNNLYSSVIKAGTYLASSIKVAEAAKVIENSQRDINIAFVNELAKIFNLMDIDTHDVLEAAATKWNFLNFKPGLVGGHCIGVDPYYLAKKAQEYGYNPEIILAGRRMNDGMGEYIANQLIKLMINKGHRIKNSKILILGLTFKENCPDIRNTKIVDIIHHLNEYNVGIDIYDPWAKYDEVYSEYKLSLLAQLPNKKYDSVLIAVAHNQFLNLNISDYLTDDSVVYDVKGILKNGFDKRL